MGVALQDLGQSCGEQATQGGSLGLGVVPWCGVGERGGPGSHAISLNRSLVKIIKSNWEQDGGNILISGK